MTDSQGQRVLWHWAPADLLDFRPAPVPLPTVPPRSRPLVDISRDDWRVTAHTWLGPPGAAGQSLLTITAPDGDTAGVLVAKKTRGFAATELGKLLPGLRILLRPNRDSRGTRVAWLSVPTLHAAIQTLTGAHGVDGLHDEWTPRRWLGWASTGLTDIRDIERTWGARRVTDSPWWDYYRNGFTPDEALRWHRALGLDWSPHQLVPWQEALHDPERVRAWRDQVLNLNVRCAANAYRAGWTPDDILDVIAIPRERLLRQGIDDGHQVNNSGLTKAFAELPAVVPDVARAKAYLAAGISIDEAREMEAAAQPPSLDALEMLAAFGPGT